MLTRRLTARLLGSAPLAAPALLRAQGHKAEHKISVVGHCLFKLGLPLGEFWHLTELAAWLRAHGRHRFFLTAPPLRLPKAAGSPVTPIATV